MKRMIKKVTVTTRVFDDPLAYFEPFAAKDMAVLLTGGADHETGRYSIAAYGPAALFYHDGTGFFMETGRGKRHIARDLWEGLRSMTSLEDGCFSKGHAALCGAVGFITFDAYHTIEDINPTVRRPYELPCARFVYYDTYIVWDHMEKKSFEIRPEYLIAPVKPEGGRASGSDFALSGLEGECSKEEYMAKVERVREHIREGYVYEVNLSQLFRGRFSGSPFAFFKRIFTANPAPFSAYMNHRDAAVICNSPEMFISCRDGNAETRPIKGTAPRGKSPEEDVRLRDMLLDSEKEKAELFMITDLLRNDMNKTCAPGSVKVIHARMIEAYENVFQAVSVIRGDLDKKRDMADLLKGAFPGGSVTGCPKYTCLKVIDELEEHERVLYTGSIMVLNARSVISNIVIRTAVIKDGICYLNSGGAVTIDSDPEGEYDEIMAKISNFKKAVCP